MRPGLELGAARTAPTRQCEHSAEAREARAPQRWKACRTTRCRTGTEAKALPFQLNTNLPMVENLTVEHDTTFLSGLRTGWSPAARSRMRKRVAPREICRETKHP